MKCVLSSSGVRNISIAEAVLNLVGSKDQIHTVIVTTAYDAEDGDKTWWLDEVADYRKYVGGSLDFLNINALSPTLCLERLKKADIIYITGGHTDYLMQSLLKTGIANKLPQLLKSKLYVGSSAGAMVMGVRLSSEAYKFMYREQTDDPRHISSPIRQYMEYMSFSIIAHLNSPDFPIRKESFLQDVANLQEGQVYVLDDDSAVVVDGTQISVISEGEWFQHG